MTIVEMTKRELIEAINQEELVRDCWIKSDVQFSSPECTVCAVGAIFKKCIDTSSVGRSTSSLNCFIAGQVKRATLANQEAPDVSDNTYPTLEKLILPVLEKSGPLSALSCFFEAYMHPGVTKFPLQAEIKMHLTRFINENFPETIDVNIGSFAAATDVKKV